MDIRPDRDLLILPQRTLGILSDLSPATPSDASEEAPGAANVWDGHKTHIRTAVMKVTEGRSQTDGEDNREGVVKKSLKFRLSLMDKNEKGIEDSVDWKALVKVWLQIPEGVENLRSVTASYTTIGKTDRKQNLPVIVDKANKSLVFNLVGDGTVDLTMVYTVEEEVFQISVNDGLVGGTIYASPMEGKKGTRVTVKAVPDSGYKLEGLSVNGTWVAADRTGSYEFSLGQDTYITGTFLRKDMDSENGSDSYETVSGWKKRGRSWYYFDEKGSMVTGWLLEGERWYLLAQDGIMQKGWLFSREDGCWYYFNQDGAMAEGWLQIDGAWYYFAGQTEGVPGWVWLNGKWSYKKPETFSRSHGSLYMNSMTPDGYAVGESGAWMQ